MDSQNVRYYLINFSKLYFTYGTFYFKIRIVINFGVYYYYISCTSLCSRFSIKLVGFNFDVLETFD